MITFANPVTVGSVTTNFGMVSSTTVTGNTVTANLTNVPNARLILVTLVGVNDGTNTGDVSIPMGVLLGDTTANGTVNSTDVTEAKANSGQATNGANFRTDVTVNGVINSSDVSTVKLQSGTAFPPSEPAQTQTDTQK